jgi:hypothetical protein
MNPAQGSTLRILTDFIENQLGHCPICHTPIDELPEGTHFVFGHCSNGHGMCSACHTEHFQLIPAASVPQDAFRLLRYNSGQIIYNCPTCKVDMFLDNFDNFEPIRCRLAEQCIETVRNGITAAIADQGLAAADRARVEHLEAKLNWAEKQVHDEKRKRELAEKKLEQMINSVQLAMGVSIMPEAPAPVAGSKRKARVADDTPVAAPAPAAAGKRKARVADDTPVDDNPENWSLDQLMEMSKGENLSSWTKTRLAFEMNELETACGEMNTIDYTDKCEKDMPSKQEMIKQVLILQCRLTTNPIVMKARRFADSKDKSKDQTYVSQAGDRPRTVRAHNSASPSQLEPLPNGLKPKNWANVRDKTADQTIQHDHFLAKRRILSKPFRDPFNTEEMNRYHAKNPHLILDWWPPASNVEGPGPWAARSATSAPEASAPAVEEAPSPAAPSPVVLSPEAPAPEAALSPEVAFSPEAAFSPAAPAPAVEQAPAPAAPSPVALSPEAALSPEVAFSPEAAFSPAAPAPAVEQAPAPAAPSPAAPSPVALSPEAAFSPAAPAPAVEQAPAPAAPSPEALSPEAAFSPAAPAPAVEQAPAPAAPSPEALSPEAAPSPAAPAPAVEQAPPTAPPSPVALSPEAAPSPAAAFSPAAPAPVTLSLAALALAPLSSFSPSAHIDEPLGDDDDDDDDYDDDDDDDDDDDYDDDDAIAEMIDNAARNAD